MPCQELCEFTQKGAVGDYAQSEPPRIKLKAVAPRLPTEAARGHPYSTWQDLQERASGKYAARLEAKKSKAARAEAALATPKKEAAKSPPPEDRKAVCSKIELGLQADNFNRQFQALRHVLDYEISVAEAQASRIGSLVRAIQKDKACSVPMREMVARVLWQITGETKRSAGGSAASEPVCKKSKA